MDDIIQYIQPQPTTEVEVSVLGIAHEDLAHLKKHFDQKGYRSSTHTALDVNYSLEPGNVYRITLQRDIEGTLEPFRQNMSFKVFQGLLKTGREVIHKVRKHVVDMPSMRLRISEETPVTSASALKELSLTRSENKKVTFRLKTRTSIIVKEAADYAIRVDMTKVSSAASFIKALDGPTTHEVEVELIFNKQLASTPPEALQALMDTAKDVMNIVATKSKQKSKSPKPTPVNVEFVKDPAVENSPDTWMMPNRIGFIQWLYKSFKYDDSASNLFTSQRFARDYLQYESPYRGLLLYHGLGVGKTCASIAAAEGFLRNQQKLIVMLPASLATNYRLEIMKCAKTWNNVNVSSEADYEDLTKEFGVSVATFKKLGSEIWLPRVPANLRTKASRTNVSWNNMSSAEQKAAITFMEAYMDKKMQFISFNGIKERQVDALGTHAFDNAFVVMDEAHNFISRYVNGGKVAKKLYQKMMQAKNLKVVLLSGTPVINHPFELAALINLVRGSMTVYDFPFLKSATIPTLENVATSLDEGGYSSYIDSLHMHMEKGKERLLLTLVPFGFVKTEEGYGIIKKAWPKVEEDMIDDIHSHLMKTLKVGKLMKTHDEYALPTDKDTFREYFLDETDVDNPIVKNSDLFMRRILGTVSYYRTAGEEFFPSTLPRVIRKIPMSPFQFANYIDIRTKERKMEKPSNGVFGSKGTVYRAFSRMTCNFTFPDGIKRPFPKDLRKELQKEISMNEDDQATDGKEEKETMVDAKKLSKTYDEKLQAALNSLKSRSKEFLTESKLRDLYSPKYATILKDMEESPGSCLLYSQFRTVEGLGLYRMVLEAAGYKEIEVERKGREWTIVNKEVLSPTFNNKRFIVFNEDRDKTEVLMKIFNSQWSELPSGLQEELQMMQSPRQRNLYGDVAKVMMISQSGAEGISLRNVRRVFIMEPFWNMVRIDQVIGRAIRTRSHEELPVQDRNVQVFIYMSTFTPEQLKKDFTLQRKDHSLSSDEHIMRIAEHKDAITRNFLDMLKRASVDCLTHASKNKTLTNGMQCFMFPVNAEPHDAAFETTFSQDISKLSQQKRIRKTKIRGKVVTRDGVKYVVLENKPGLYDYAAYKDAGALVPAML